MKREWGRNEWHPDFESNGITSSAHLLGCVGMGNYVQISHLYQSVQNLHTRLEVQKIQKKQQIFCLVVISAIENNNNHQHHHQHYH
jgi:hypothetical protein